MVKSSNKDGQGLMIETEVLEEELSYSPPNYHSFGLSPSQTDPFELGTVEVRKGAVKHSSVTVTAGSGHCHG